MGTDIENKEEQARALTDKAEKAVKFLKITVLITVACVILLPVLSLILFAITQKTVFWLAGLAASLCVFAIMLAVLGGVTVYAAKQLKKLRSLDEKGDGQK